MRQFLRFMPFWILFYFSVRQLVAASQFCIFDYLFGGKNTDATDI